MEGVKKGKINLETTNKSMDVTRHFKWKYNIVSYKKGEKRKIKTVCIIFFTNMKNYHFNVELNDTINTNPGKIHTFYVI